MSRAGSLNTFRNKKQYFVNCTQISLLNIIINIFEYMLDAFESSLPDFCHKNVKRLFQYYRFPSRRFSASEGTRGYLCRNKDKKTAVPGTGTAAFKVYCILFVSDYICRNKCRRNEPDTFRHADKFTDVRHLHSSEGEAAVALITAEGRRE